MVGAAPRAAGAGSAAAPPRERRRRRSRRRSGRRSRRRGSSAQDTEEVGAEEPFPWRPGLVLDGRYRLLELLGEGTFGRCLLAEDTRGEQAAVKVIPGAERSADAQVEARILRHIRSVDPRAESGCLALWDDFVYDGRFYCLVTEPLGESLGDILRRNYFRGFWMQDLQDFARQCLRALAFLHRAPLLLTHTDLKPENVLLRCRAPLQETFFPRVGDWTVRTKEFAEELQGAGKYWRPVDSNVKLIDFGNARYEHDRSPQALINAQPYRGPEAVLGAGWDEKSDLWSLGCVLWELYAGPQLFQVEGDPDFEHLALMSQAFDTMPQALLSRADPDRLAENFVQDPQTRQWRLAFPERAEPALVKRVKEQADLDDILRKHATFQQFLSRLLLVEPERRPSAARILHHPFLLQTPEE